MKLHAEGQWPTQSVPRNPWQASWPDDDMGWRDLSRSTLTPRLTLTAHRAAVHEVQRALDAAWRGESVSVQDLTALCAPIQVRTSWTQDAAAPEVAPFEVPEPHIVRIGCDHAPDAGMLAPDKLLGPWFAGIDLADPSDRRTAAWCVAHWACSRVANRWPTRAWANAKPVPPVALRAAVRAVTRAPMGVWKAVPEGDRWRLRDRVGISGRMSPDQPVDLHQAAGIRPLTPGCTVLIRPVPVHCAWQAFAPIVLPADPPEHVIARVIGLQLIARRLRNRRAHVEDALRDRAHHVAGALHLWAWHHLECAGGGL